MASAMAPTLRSVPGSAQQAIQGEPSAPDGTFENNVARLADDHTLAKRFADKISGIAGIELWPVETNLVFFNVKETGLTAKIFHERLLERGVRIGIKNEYEMRAVTHLDVDSGEIAQAADAVAQVAAAA